jgi:UMF1 family MFS transporter
VVAAVGSTALLWLATPARDQVSFALTCVLIATVAFELANVFYNAMLDDVAPKGMLGRVSGWAWGLGYAGGLCCLAVALVGFIRTDSPWFGLSRDGAENVRATALLVAVWFGVFSIPLFLFTPDAPETGVRPRAAIREGLVQLLHTVRGLRRHTDSLRFLIASALYRDGLATLFAMGGLYAAGTFAMPMEEILMFAMGMNVTAGLGAAGFAWLDDAIGSRRTVLFALMGLVGFGLPILLVSDPTAFVLIALGLGIFVGPAQAASRSLMARLAPPELETEMFGLYAFAGKSVAFLGPLAFAFATDIFGSQRAGVATILLFFIAGGAILHGVREPK